MYIDSKWIGGQWGPGGRWFRLERHTVEHFRVVDMLHFVYAYFCQNTKNYNFNR